MLSTLKTPRNLSDLPQSGRRLCLLAGSSYGTILTLPILKKESPPMSVWPVLVSTVFCVLFNLPPLFAADQPSQALLTPLTG